MVCFYAFAFTRYAKSYTDKMYLCGPCHLIWVIVDSSAVIIIDVAVVIKWPGALRLSCWSYSLSSILVRLLLVAASSLSLSGAVASSFVHEIPT